MITTTSLRLTIYDCYHLLCTYVLLTNYDWTPATYILQFAPYYLPRTIYYLQLMVYCVRLATYVVQLTTSYILRAT